MGFADVVLLGLVALWLFLVIVFLVKKKKAGECVGCSGGTCMNCPKKDSVKCIKEKKYH